MPKYFEKSWHGGLRQKGYKGKNPGAAMSEKFFLAGDVGGTKSILALFSREQGPYTPVFEKTVQSATIQNFGEAANEFLRENKVEIAGSCFGVAGPVFAGRVTITKLGWILTEEELKKTLAAQPVSLLNDLAATACSLPVLHNTDLCQLNQGRADRHGAKAIIAPGTGLGEVSLTWNQKEYLVHPSEGGHALFAPVTGLHRELLDYLSRDNEQITYDLICSGRGIPLIYAFLKHEKKEDEPPWLKDKLSQVADQAPAIVDSALGPGEKARISVRTLEIFVEILASEAANLALKTLATGGVYLAGGIPPRILELLKEKSFVTQFSSRKPFENLLAEIPVNVILNHKAALIGAAYHGMKKIGWLQ
jgi:glucokinase